MADIALRPETAADEPFLRSLYASTRGDEMAMMPWPDPQKQAFLQMQFDLQRAHYRQHYPTARFALVWRDDAPIGRFYVDIGEDAVTVIDIALLSEHRGLGIGRALLEGLLAEAGDAGKPVRLRVQTGNRASNLYHRLGFRQLDDDGIYRLMEWTL